MHKAEKGWLRPCNDGRGYRESGAAEEIITREKSVTGPSLNAARDKRLDPEIPTLRPGNLRSGLRFFASEFLQRAKSQGKLRGKHKAS